MTADRLAKVCGMLGSPFAGERASAALAATALVRGMGFTWRELVERAMRPEPPQEKKPCPAPEPPRAEPKPEPPLDAQLREAQLLTDWLRDKWPHDLISAAEIVKYGPNSIRDTKIVRELLTILEVSDHVSKAGRQPVKQSSGEQLMRRETWRISKAAKR
jgi:hypothetical protein